MPQMEKVLKHLVEGLLVELGMIPSGVSNPPIVTTRRVPGASGWWSVNVMFAGWGGRTLKFSFGPSPEGTTDEHHVESKMMEAWGNFSRRLEIGGGDPSEARQRAKERRLARERQHSENRDRIKGDQHGEEKGGQKAGQANASQAKAVNSGQGKKPRRRNRKRGKGGK